MPDIKLKNIYGEECVHYNVDVITVPSSEGYNKIPFTYGEAVSKTVEPDFSAGDMAVEIPEGQLVNELTITKPETLIPENIAAGIAVAGIIGTHRGGSGWSPAGADYTWTYAFFNTNLGAEWDRLLPMLSYDENGECVIAEFFTAEGVRGSDLEELIAVKEESQAYAVYYVRTLDAGTEEEFQDWTIVYATDDIPAQDDGLFAPRGFSSTTLELSYNSETGSLVPVIVEPVSGVLTGWNDFWAGSEISFGDFDDESDRRIGKDIITNLVTKLTANDFGKWFSVSGVNTLTIRPYFFKDNVNLESVELHPFTYEIGESAFEGCISLAEVKYPSGNSGFYMITTIGARAFYGCSSLKTVDIHASIYLRDIRDYAFANCQNLTTVTVRQYHPIPVLGTGVFDTTSLQHIYVPASAVASYKAANGWSAYASYITAIPS